MASTSLGLFRANESEFGTRWKKKALLLRPSKAEPDKNLYGKSERLTVSCRVIWAWSERVNWYSRQIMILLRETTKYAPWSGPWPPTGSRASVICTGYPPLSSAQVSLAISAHETNRWFKIRAPQWVNNGNLLMLTNILSRPEHRVACLRISVVFVSISVNCQFYNVNYTTMACFYILSKALFLNCRPGLCYS
jgi:hypothetical protein